MAAPALQIGVALPHERRAALELVLRSVAPEGRQALVDAVAGQPRERLGPIDALIVARDGDRVVAATWAQPSPGRAAGLWPPETSDDRAAVAIDALIAAALRAIDAAGVAMTQVLFESEPTTHASPPSSGRGSSAWRSCSTSGAACGRPTRSGCPKPTRCSSPTANPTTTG